MERWIRSLLAGIFLMVLFSGTVSAEAAMEIVQTDSVSEGAGEETVGETVSEYGAEDYDYTDTDTRRGILAVRMEAFEGFHGTAEITVCGKESGREWQILLKQEAFYQANQELPIGEYRISGILAVSEGRAFDCLAEPAEFSLTEGKTAFCRVSVFPGSVYRIPYEEDEMGGLEPEIGESSNGEGKLEDKKTNGGGSINALGETGENGDSEADRGSTENGIPAAFAVGLAGFMGCAGWIFRLLTKKRGGGV